MIDKRVEQLNELLQEFRKQGYQFTFCDKGIVAFKGIRPGGTFWGVRDRIHIQGIR